MVALGKFREQRRGACLYRGKQGVGRGDFDRKAIGKEQEFGVVTTSHWLSCGGSH